VSDALSATVDFLHNELVTEKNAAFPRLKRVPDTLVFKFIDYVGNLAAAEEAELLPLLAKKAALHFLPERGSEMPAIMANPAYQKFVSAWSGGLAGGIRYTPVHLLAGIAEDKNVGGLDGWVAQMGFGGPTLEPPQGFLVDVANIRPAKIPALRKQIDAELKKLFAATPQTETSQEKAEPSIPTFLSLARAKMKMKPLPEGVVAGSRLKVIVEYGNQYAFHQLKYMVNLHHTGRSLKLNYLGYESLWTAGTGAWNYITEAYVPRAAELLGELLTYLAELPGRMPEECFRK
jgi:hypothetical protein